MGTGSAAARRVGGPSLDAVTEHQILDALAIADGDRPGCLKLLAGAADQAAVAAAESELAARLGTFSVAPLDLACTDPMVWLTAFLRRTPAVESWYRDRGVPVEVIRATFADVGRNLAKSRSVHGTLSLETWDWLIPHYTGMMFALGRLNFMLHPAPASIGGVLTAGEWYVGIHIPESGPLTPAAVDASLAHAVTFFAEFFPHQAVSTAVCESWLLDPGLVAGMSASTNIGAFGRRFTPLAPEYDDASAALFFVFRTRDLALVPTLPRDTALRRLVLDRATGTDGWQIGTGFLRL